LIFDGELPSQARVDEITQKIADYRSLTPEQVAFARSAAKLTHPMFAVQAAAAILGPQDNDFERKVETVEERGYELVAKMGHMVAAIAEAWAGGEYSGPRDGESHARFMLRMITGEEPSDLHVRV